MPVEVIRKVSNLIVSIYPPSLTIKDSQRVKEAGAGINRRGFKDRRSQDLLEKNSDSSFDSSWGLI